MDEGSEYLKLPVEDRVVHGLWKARLSGYEEARKCFNQWDDDDPSWKKFSGLIKKFVSDGNAAAQDKGLEAALNFVENSGIAKKTASDVVEALVSKCLAGPKPKTKDLARQIILKYCEIEEYDKVIEELTKGLLQKNPKTVAGCISCLTDCLRVFGAKIIKASILIKSVLPLLDNRDKLIRDESKLLIVEAYRWIGDVTIHLIGGCKPVQTSELEAEFEKLKGCGKPKPERLLRSQQTFEPEEIQRESDGRVDEAEDTCTTEEDTFDILDPVNILEKLPPNFYQLVEEKKWQLRKEALESLLPLSKVPKIAVGDFNELTRVLKNTLAKDSNVVLVALSSQCLGGLAKGLREGFRAGASDCFPSILEKFKEKKASVLSALVETIDEFFRILGIEVILDDCLAALKHKTPSVNAETAKFLARSFSSCPTAIFSNKKLQKSYSLGLADCLLHSDVAVRDAASEALGVLVKLFGEPFLTKLLPELDTLKLSKIKEFAQKTQLSGKPPKPQSGNQGCKIMKTAGTPNKIRKENPRSNLSPKQVATPNEEDFQQNWNVKPKSPVQKHQDLVEEESNETPSKQPPKKLQPQKSPTTKPKKKGEDSISGKLYSANSLKQSRFKEELKFKTLKWSFTQPRPEFVEQLQDQLNGASFDPHLMTCMFHHDFKFHLKALEHLSDFIENDFEALTSNLDLILKWTTLRFFETNTSVLLRTLEYLDKIFKCLSSNGYCLHDIEAISFIPYLVNKFGEQNPKVKDYNHSILEHLFKIFSPSKISSHIMEGIKSKNSKQKAECLEEMASIIKTFGLNVLQPNPASCVKEISKVLAQRDAMVRNAALKALIEAFFQVGERLFAMIGDLPEKELSLLVERVKRVSNQDGMVLTTPEKTVSNILDKAPQKHTESRTVTLRAKTNVRSDNPQSTKQIPRPKSRVFSLNLEKMETLPQSDTNEAIKEKPQKAILKQPSTRFLKPAEECDVILAKIMSHDSSVAISALSKANDIITQNVDIIGQRLDQLLTSCFIQYRHVLYHKLKENHQSKEVVNLVQHATMVLMTTYSKPDLVKEVTTASLQDLLHMIMSLMVSSDFKELSENSNICKTLNILLQKMVDLSDVCCVTCALIKLLKDSICSFSAPQEFQELVQKCMMRVTKILPDKIGEQRNFDKIFSEANNFMKTFPATFWKSQSSSIPLSTVKTVVHTCVLVLGENTLKHVSRIQDFRNSELFNYVQKLIVTENPAFKMQNGQKENDSNYDDLQTNNNEEKIIQIVRMPEKLGYFNHQKDSCLNIQEQTSVRQSKVYISTESSIRPAEVNGSLSYLDRLKALRSKAGLESSSLYYRSSFVNEDY